MKKFTKIMGLMVAAIMMVSMLAACGGGGNADAKYEGKYTAVAGEMLGMALTGEEIAGFDVELKAKGKGTFTIEGDSASIKWTNDETNITIKLQGEELVGEIGQDTIKFVDMLGMGMDITFAKEGSDAAKPENYYPEEEKKLIGTWKSNAVADILGDDMSAEIAPDGLTVEFKGDKNAVVTLNGEEIGTYPWSMYAGFGSFDDEDSSHTWEYVGEDLEFTYSDGDDYYIFTCSKQ